MLKITPIVKDLNDSKINIPQEAANTFRAVESLIINMMDELKVILDDARKTRKEFGLRKFENELYRHLMSKEFEMVNGKLISQLQEEVLHGKKPTANKEEAIRNSWEYHKS